MSMLYLAVQQVSAPEMTHANRIVFFALFLAFFLLASVILAGSASGPTRRRR
jgi:hypothetical protein